MLPDECWRALRVLFEWRYATIIYLFFLLFLGGGQRVVPDRHFWILELEGREDISLYDTTAGNDKEDGEGQIYIK